MESVGPVAVELVPTKAALTASMEVVLENLVEKAAMEKGEAGSVGAAEVAAGRVGVAERTGRGPSGPSTWRPGCARQCAAIEQDSNLRRGVRPGSR